MNQRDIVVRCMREQVGDQYEWAQAGPDRFDCSGLVSYCLARVGVDISRGSAEQWNRTKQHWIPTEQAQPGDLVFWGPSSNASHVGVVVSPGRVISAMNETDDIKETALMGQYGAPLLGVVSILDPTESSPSSTTPPSEPSRPDPSSKSLRRKHRRRRLEQHP